nr:replication protein A 70 kDa DNA-binding subunit B-like isoform X2 [Coffea arabica]
MEPVIIPLSAIHPHSSNWTVALQVIEVSQTKKKSHLQQNFRTFVLADSQGVKVNMHVIGNMIDQLAGLLLPLKKYYISGAIVHQLHDGSTPTEYPFYWIVTQATSIREIEELDYPSLPLHFRLYPFTMLDAVADTEQLITIMAVILHALPNKIIPVEGAPCVLRDYVIANEDMKPLILTLRGEFEEIYGPTIAAAKDPFPVIIAIRVKATTNHYLSLSTESSSVILIAPIAQQAMHLQNWHHTHADVLRQMLNQSSYTNPRILLPPVNNNRITHIATVLQQKPRTAWIQGIVELDCVPLKLTYIACSLCYYPSKLVSNLPVPCQHCRSNADLVPRALIAISLTDATGSLCAAAIDIEAERLIQYSTAELYYLQQENVDLTQYLARTLHGKLLMCYIKPSPSKFKPIRRAAYEIITSYAIDELFNAENINMNNLNING